LEGCVSKPEIPLEWSAVCPQLAKKKGVRDIELGNGVVVFDVLNLRYTLVAGSDLARFRRERGLVMALKYVLNQKSKV
jgi:hypothetical protein